MKKPTNKRVLLIAAALIIAGGYTLYVRSSNKPEEQTPPPSNGPSIIIDQAPPIEEEAPREILIEAKAEIHQIEGQNVFTAWPEVLEGDVPIVIVYNHGSTLHVLDDFSTQFMKDLQYYGELSVQEGYIFSASNAHGDNWGSDQALEDINLQLQFIATELGVELEEMEYYFIGYSMGGLPTMNYTTGYEPRPTKIALLAPTVYIWQWNATRYATLEEIDIKIWHGDGDVNVPLYLSTNLVSGASNYGKTIDHEIIEGAGHFDIDTELAQNIFDFFRQETLESE